MAEIEQLRELGFDPEVQSRAKRYQAEGFRLKAIEYGVYLAALLVFAAFGSAGLARWVGGFVPHMWPLNLIYTLVFVAGLTLLRLFFSWFGFRIEQRYELSTQSARCWFNDELKRGLVRLFMCLVAFPGIYMGVARSDMWWLTTWGITTVFIILMSFISPVVLMPRFYKFEPLQDQDLVDRLRSLAGRSGVKVIGFFRMAAGAKTRKAIGALAGIGATRRIILSDTLLENYTPDEIEAVIAHELGHHLHRDVWKTVAALSGLALCALYITHLALGPLAAALGLGRGIESLPVFLIILGGVFFLLAPLRSNLTRRFEGRADQFALELANKPEAQRNLMVKLHDQNLSFAAPHPVIEFLFDDHPSGLKRVQRTLRFESESNQGTQY